MRQLLSSPQKGTREQRVRNILEQIFRSPFPIIRVRIFDDWLVKPIAVRRLQLL